MKFVLIVLMLVGFTSHAFEPGERIALQMKPGLQVFGYSSKYRKYVRGLTGSFKTTLEKKFELKDDQYKNIIKDVNTTDLYKREKYFLSLSSQLEDEKDYFNLIDSFNDMCNYSYLTFTPPSYKTNVINKIATVKMPNVQNPIDDKCIKMKAEITNKRIEIFKTEGSNGTSENTQFETAKNQLIESINDNIKAMLKDKLSEAKIKELTEYVGQYVYVQKLKYLVGFEIMEYNDLFKEAIEENTDNKIASSISPTLVDGLGSKLHVNLYRGRFSNGRIPITLKAAAVNYDELDQNAKMVDTLMDYSGGLLNLRVDFLNWVNSSFDPQTDYLNYDSYGLSLQAGGKFDNYPGLGEDNSSESILTPYISAVVQADWNLYSNNDLLRKEGYLLTGLNLSYQYVDKDFRKSLEIENSNLYTWEVYAKFYISEKFGLKINYTQAFSQAKDVLDSRTYISFDIEP